MPSADPGAPVRPADVERWLSDLGLEPVERAERDGIASWDLVLDGRRRFDLRVTVILDPSLALICWAHFAPPITDMFRKSYRRLLRWNDEFPFAKFSVGEDERPLLAVELPIGIGATAPDLDDFGTALVRIVGIADRLFDESKDWLDFGPRPAAATVTDRVPRHAALLARYAPRLPELFDEDTDAGALAQADAADDAGTAIADFPR
jgi:hypothetical protein